MNTGLQHFQHPSLWFGFAMKSLGNRKTETTEVVRISPVIKWVRNKWPVKIHRIIWEIICPDNQALARDLLTNYSL